MEEAQQIDERGKRLEQETKAARDRLEEMVTAKAELELRLAEAERTAAEVDRLQKRCEALEETRDSLTAEVATMKRSIDEAEAKEREMTAQLAAEKEALQVTELQVASGIREVQQLQAALQSQRDLQTRLVRTLEGKAASLKKDYATVKMELDETKKEFEAYKIKAHSMIKIVSERFNVHCSFSCSQVSS